jgi:hypothetical protein
MTNKETVSLAQNHSKREAFAQLRDALDDVERSGLFAYLEKFDTPNIIGRFCSFITDFAPEIVKTNGEDE